jgi:murein DD-endopeptidase MepM/ murein hydrolase activator NlpD
MRKARAIALLLALSPAAAAQQYRLPLELPDSGTRPYVTAYRDHDGSGALKDYACSNETYDGHKGTDYGIGSWPVMDAGSRWIVAAADGKVTYVNDGCFDRCSDAKCACGAGFGNYVKLEHADGKLTYYAHMMNGSVQVSVGQQVACGERLGKVGSSGYSTGPHVHFEPRYANNVSDDPYAGDCSGPVSFWVEQGAYKALPADRCQERPPEVDDARRVSEAPEGSIGADPGQIIDKSWTLQNTGTTTWTRAARFLWTHDGEETFSAPLQTELEESESIAPGSQRTFSLSLTAPELPGTFRGYYRMDRFGTARFGERVEVVVEVRERPGEPDAGGWGGADGSGGDGWSGGNGWSGASGIASGGKSSSSQRTRVTAEEEASGCGCWMAGTPDRRALWLLLFGALMGLRARVRPRS